MSGLIGGTLVNAVLQPAGQQLQARHKKLNNFLSVYLPISVFNLSDQLVYVEFATSIGDQLLDCLFGRVNFQQSSDNNWQSASIHLVHEDFNRLVQVATVQVKDKIVDHVETVANNHQRLLIGQFCLLQVVFDQFRVVAVGFAANALDLLQLPSSSCSLNSKV
jgi:hypothetical protein